ncbi:MAG: hypothetical protein IPM79_32285 [Polyangiaceae bacterium]|jgi:hypothetical protein|nr:hypothetical protein [Polyangiaceae bacterium]MBK8942161.1 hypothetical protein [Polyangiaceae bacterium]
MSDRALWLAAIGLSCFGCNLVLGTEEGVLSGGAGTGAGPTTGGGGEGVGAGPTGGSGGEGGAVEGCELASDCPDRTDCFDPDCVGGACLGVPSPEGTTCGRSGALTCDGEGTCVGCLVESDCGTDTACADTSCLPGGQCETAYLPGTIVADPTMGDCLALGCVEGQPDPVAVADDSDVPVDGDECTSDVCTSGVPSNPLLPEGTTCELGVCLVDGSCGCDGATDCTLSSAGSTCLASDVCGCTSDFQCAFSPWGEQCLGMTDTCGCNGQGDCDNGEVCDLVTDRCVTP